MPALVGVLHFEMSNFPFLVVVLHPPNIILRKKMKSENFLLVCFMPGLWPRSGPFLK